MAKTKKSGAPTTGLTFGVHLYRTWTEQRIGQKGHWEYRWVAIAANSLRICSSTEGYNSKQQCIKSIQVAAKIFHAIALGGGFYNGYTDHTLKVPTERKFTSRIKGFNA
jgi:uncharacterized protein YegP (UPF0339 family)